MFRNRLKPESSEGEHSQIIKHFCYVSLRQADPICCTETVTDQKQNYSVLSEDEETLSKEVNH